MPNAIKLPLAVQERLRCPICTAKLTLSEGQFTCANSAVPHSFPVVDGIPVLLNEQESLFSIDDFLHRRSTFFDLSPSGRMLQMLDRLVPTMHTDRQKKENMDRLGRLLLQQAKAPCVLVIGGSILGAGMENLLRYSPPIELVDSDVSLGPRTTLICDAHDIPFEDGSFDGVIAQAVLEHVVDPWRCVSEIHRVLKKGGIVYAETPFMQPVHAGAYDFTRFTHLGHRRLFRQFEEIATGTGQGPGTALAWTYQYFLLGFAQSGLPRRLLRAFGRLTSFYLKYFDRYLGSKPGAFDSSSGYFFLGRKGERTLSDRELVTLYRGAIR